MGIMDLIVEELNKDKKENDPKWQRLHSEQYQIVQTKNGCFHNPVKTKKEVKEEIKLYTYKAEFAENEMEIFTTTSDAKAYNEALEMEKEFGTLWNLILLDDDYNEIKTIF